VHTILTDKHTIDKTQIHRLLTRATDTQSSAIKSRQVHPQSGSLTQSHSSTVAASRTYTLPSAQRATQHAHETRPYTRNRVQLIVRRLSFGSCSVTPLPHLARFLGYSTPPPSRVCGSRASARPRAVLCAPPPHRPPPRHLGLGAKPLGKAEWILSIFAMMPASGGYHFSRFSTCSEDDCERRTSYQPGSRTGHTGLSGNE
jgi:hypothetical protein